MPYLNLVLFNLITIIYTVHTQNIYLLI